MIIKTQGTVINFKCHICGCEYIVGIRAIKSNDGNYYCNCPCCGSECHADVNDVDVIGETT